MINFFSECELEWMGKMNNYNENNNFANDRISIERQLEMYEKHPARSERSAVLWHAWRQNKSWLIRLLELTLASFPGYSQHNASHAEAVLHNIERILGERRIRELSATDCFAILHTVYVHDIGMAILAADRKKIVLSDEFVDMVDELSVGADDDLKKAALQLKKRCYHSRDSKEIDLGGQEYYAESQTLFGEKLETYYAVIQLLAEYQRKSHGDISASRVKDWVKDEDKLRSEFAMSGIPMRIFLRIADCACLHTDWEFQHIMEMPVEENGYDNDMLHPRFVAILLQLGDALDIDNDRFHPFAQAFLGKFPMQSQAHYDKHMAIRTLKITPEEIFIEADCETREAMRLVRNECDSLETLLKSASYYWSSIAPKGFSGALPSFASPHLLLKGKAIPLDLAMMHFQISQKKAFSLLQGENIYSGYFPFVRELLQNAIDSTKIQCYKDYVTSSKFRYNKKRNAVEPPSIMNISKIINPVEYPIEIVMKCGKVDERGAWREVAFESIPEKCPKNEEYGILFYIKDYGTGINKETLRSISDVGTSYQNRKKMTRQMPDWLRPTGEFGIGLQSVFLVTDKFYCETYVRNGERYGIEFRTGANGEKGYINVEPKNAEADPMAYGTEFKVFINHKQMKEKNEFMEAWPGYDPFSEEYENEEIRRNIITLAAQILLDIDSQMADLLFPVYAYVDWQIPVRYKEKLKLTNVVLEESIHSDKYSEETLRKSVCWIYGHADEAEGTNIVKVFDTGMCRVDLDTMKINLWVEDISTSAQIGVSRIVSDGCDGVLTDELCSLYYKGILIEKQKVRNDFDLLEYIDIQGGKNSKSLLQLDRNGFTESGEKYIQDIVVPKIYQTLFDVLRLIVDQHFKVWEYSNEESKKVLKEVLFTEAVEIIFRTSLQNAIEHDKNNRAWCKQLMGISLLYNFYMLERKDAISAYVSEKSQNETKKWLDTIKKVGTILDEKRGDMVRTEIIDVMGNLYASELSFENGLPNWKNVNISIADFFCEENKFAVVSSRRYKGDKWINYLVKLGKIQAESNIIKIIEREAKNYTEIQKKQSDIEEEAKQILGIVKNMEKQPILQNDFIQWLLKFVPVVGNFCDFQGNFRVHILSGNPLRGIYYNENAKYALLKKIEQRNIETNASRFAVNSWVGYEPLRIQKVQSDVCIVSENYTYDNKGIMLFPYLGETVHQLVKFAENYELDIKMKNGKTDMMSDKDLSIIGKKLDECVCLDYKNVSEKRNELFEQQYQATCMRERKYVEPLSYWERLFNSYVLMIKNKFKEMLENSSTLEGTLIEEQMLALKKALITEEEADKLKEEIYDILLKDDIFFFTGVLEDQNEVKRVEDVLECLANNCICWKKMWDYQIDKNIENGIDEICNKSNWRNSVERKNMSDMISAQNHVDLDTVQECGDRLVDEIKEMMINHTKKSVEDQISYKFCGWIAEFKGKGVVNE